MSDISNTETAILGLLYEHHHYAYRLEEIIEKRSMCDWADVDFSSIYDVLGKLEEKNLVKSALKGESSKKVYYITDDGKLAFLEKIRELMTNSKAIYPFDLAIANMHLLSNEEIIKDLNTYLKSIEERIEFIDASIKMQEENDVPYNFTAILSRSYALLEAERDWIKEFIEKIKANSEI